MSLTKRPPRKRSINDADFELDQNENEIRKKRRIEDKVLLMGTPISKRQFYHIQSHERYMIENNVDIVDSEDDSDYESLNRQIHQNQLNKNQCLSEGEKQMMNMWARYIEKQNYCGKKHMRLVCCGFIDSYGGEILRMNLYRHFLLHLCNLRDFSVIKSKDVFDLVQHMQKHMGIDELTSKLVRSPRGRPRKSESKNAKKEEDKRKSITTENQENQQRYGLRSSKMIALG